jgi:hypothetical protein
MAALARRQKWTVTYTGSGHLRWQPPSGGPVYTPSTPGKGRSVENCIADLRRAGLTLETS